MEPNNQGTQTLGDSGSSPTATGAEQARRIGRQARTRVFSVMDQGKETIADQLEGLVDKLPSGVQIPFVSDGASKVRALTDTLRNNDAEALLEEVKWQAQKRPGYFMIGAFAVGFLAARLLRDVGSEG